MHEFDTGDALDAIAFWKAYLVHDEQGLAMLAEHGDPAAMLAATISIATGLLTPTPDVLPALASHLDSIATRFLARVTPGEGGDSA